MLALLQNDIALEGITATGRHALRQCTSTIVRRCVGTRIGSKAVVAGPSVLESWGGIVVCVWVSREVAPTNLVGGVPSSLIASGRNLIDTGAT